MRIQPQELSVCYILTILSLLILGMTYLLAPVLTATFGSSQYYALQQHTFDMQIAQNIELQKMKLAAAGETSVPRKRKLKGSGPSGIPGIVAEHTNVTSIDAAVKPVEDQCRKPNTTMEISPAQADKETKLLEMKLAGKREEQERLLETEKYKAKGEVLKAMMEAHRKDDWYFWATKAEARYLVGVYMQG